MKERLETKRLAKPFTFKALGEEGGAIEGHGAVFDEPCPTSSWALPPDWMDVVRPGAFKKTIAEAKKRSVMPAMLLQHDRWGLPVGAWTSADEDADGLKLTGQLATKTEQGADLYELMKIGAINGLSIGFCPVKFKLDEKTRTRELIEVDLAEVSIVTFPAIDSARVTDVKSADPALKRHLETVLRDAGLSRTEAKAIVAEGFKGLDLRDAGGEVPGLNEYVQSMQDPLYR